ncbi:MAG: hypothetical protein ACTHKZ_06105 [Lysobacteraceae bacterium]
MRAIARMLLSFLSLVAVPAAAQSVVRNDELLDGDRPEAWAMHYVAASSLFTATGATPVLAPGEWRAAVDLAQVPRLDERQQVVGFNGLKREDLNRSPVFGRARAWIGLPGGWVGELGYTPPLRVRGTQARHFLALAVARRIVERGSFALSARLFGQHGAIAGDITCPARLAGIDDPARNPYGCQAPSRDVAEINDYGIGLASSWTRGRWQAYVETAVLRTETQVQVDARVFDARDRSRLVAHDVLGSVAAGVRRELGAHFDWGAELLFVPLRVRRGAGAPSERDDFSGVRLQLRYRP